MASPSLLWGCLRNNSSFLVKRNGVQLTSEPGNVMNKNTFKYSGLCNEKTIDIRYDKTLTLGLKAPKRKQQPKNSVRVTPLNKNFRRVAHAIESQTKGQWYRADLTDMALARWTALHRLSQVDKGLKKKAKAKLGRRKDA